MALRLKISDGAHENTNIWDGDYQYPTYWVQYYGDNDHRVEIRYQNWGADTTNTLGPFLRISGSSLRFYFWLRPSVKAKNKIRFNFYRTSDTSTPPLTSVDMPWDSFVNSCHSYYVDEEDDTADLAAMNQSTYMEAVMLGGDALLC
jgi:hypothetical protein